MASLFSARWLKTHVWPHSKSVYVSTQSKLGTDTDFVYLDVTYHIWYLCYIQIFLVYFSQMRCTPKISAKPAPHGRVAPMNLSHDHVKPLFGSIEWRWRWFTCMIWLLHWVMRHWSNLLRSPENELSTPKISAGSNLCICIKLLHPAFAFACSTCCLMSCFNLWYWLSIFRLFSVSCLWMELSSPSVIGANSCVYVLMTYKA